LKKKKETLDLRFGGEGGLGFELRWVLGFDGEGGELK
jgi:hypothetical protein